MDHTRALSFRSQFPAPPPDRGGLKCMRVCEGGGSHAGTKIYRAFVTPDPSLVLPHAILHVLIDSTQPEDHITCLHLMGFQCKSWPRPYLFLLNPSLALPGLPRTILHVLIDASNAELFVTRRGRHVSSSYGISM
jgi:hypothetical protein